MKLRIFFRFISALFSCSTLCVDAAGLFIGEAFKLRGSPKASSTTHFSKEMLGTEGNDLKSVVKAKRMIEREMGNPQPSPSVPVMC